MSWEDDVRAERGEMDRQWRVLKEEAAKVGRRWEDVKRGEDRLLEDRERFEKQKEEVLLRLNKERETLAAEADRLQKRETDLQLKDFANVRTTERHKIIDLDLQKQEERLSEREVLLNNLIREVVDRSAKQVVDMERLKKDLIETTVLHQQDMGLKQLRTLIEKMEEQQVKLDAKEARVAAQLQCSLPSVTASLPLMPSSTRPTRPTPLSESSFTGVDHGDSEISNLSPEAQHRFARELQASQLRISQLTME
eukprot:TRINITY_DN16754_c0_g1_i1.p1 TRINITY_DN16754_c0_g1~~TRINITY_DN16754_c0_g1_i1.p1  ORF type:complete len:252 (+),score=75.24 TRINITY_DN16754_c0_g1_i1:104-859(+)